jgi:CHAD domain-containing protein
MAKQPNKPRQQAQLSAQRADRQLLLRRTGALLRELDTLLQEPAPGPAAIHAIRLLCKRLRAWIRLVRQAGRPGCWRAPDRELRAIARHFGTQRDAQVMGGTLAKLRRNCQDPAQARSLALLQGSLSAQSRNGAQTQSAAQESAQSETVVSGPQLSQRTQVALLKLPARLEPASGLAQSQRRTLRKRDKLAAKGASPDQLHAWRKQVKYLGYQLEICSAASNEHSPAQRSCTRLGKLLGQVQDLTQLRRHLKTLKHDPTLAKSVDLARQLATQRRSQLTRQALRPRAVHALQLPSS